MSGKLKVEILRTMSPEQLEEEAAKLLGMPTEQYRHEVLIDEAIGKTDTLIRLLNEKYRREKEAAKQRLEKRQNIPNPLRFKVLLRDRFRCFYCGVEASEARLEVDHVHPISRGGRTKITNLVTSCRACNRGKGAWNWNDEEEYFEGILEYLEELNDL